MRLRKLGRPTMTALAILVLSAYGLLGAQAAPNEFRPFEGTFEGTNQTVLPSPGPGEFGFASTGTYQATHMGTGTFEAAGSIEYQRHQQAEHFECGFVNGTLQLTAANGDTLDGHIDSDRSVNCQDPDATAPFEVTLYVEVIGGTGRFADATGWYFVKSTATPSTSTPGAFDEAGYMLGSIDY
jgi:hypothetical protein